MRSSLLTLVAAAATSFAAPPAHAAPPTCRGEVATIVGTDGRDRIVGTPGRDVVAGLGGDDRLFGGPDRVERGETPYRRGDRLAGGPGDDLLDAGWDRRLRLEGGGDVVSWDDAAAVRVDLAAGTATGEGHDVVRLREGEVVLTHGDDTFRGSRWDDEVHARGGDDEIRTAGGDDVVWADDVEEVASDLVRTGSGRDAVWSLGGDDDLRTQRGRDSVQAGGRGAWVVRAGAGDDSVGVAVEVGAPDVAGGPGRDLLRLAVLTGEEAPPAYELDLGGTGFEDADLTGSPFAVRGTSGPNRVVVDSPTSFSGLGGDDAFGGSDGDDTFDGGPGRDRYLADLGGANTCISVERDPLGVCGGAQEPRLSCYPSVPRPVG